MDKYKPERFSEYSIGLKICNCLVPYIDYFSDRTCKNCGGFIISKLTGGLGEVSIRCDTCGMDLNEFKNIGKVLFLNLKNNSLECLECRNKRVYPKIETQYYAEESKHTESSYLVDSNAWYIQK